MDELENDRAISVEEIRVELLSLAIKIAIPGTSPEEIVRAAKCFENYLEEQTQSEKEEDEPTPQQHRFN